MFSVLAHRFLVLPSFRLLIVCWGLLVWGVFAHGFGHMHTIPHSIPFKLRGGRRREYLEGIN